MVFGTAQYVIIKYHSTNLDEVREEWERVKFSYEILSDPKVRKNYDRNSSVATVLEDPGAAVGRAVLGGAMSGMGMLVGGAWKLGEMATKKAYETAMSEEGQPKVVQREDTRDETTSSPSEPVSKTNNASTTGMGRDRDEDQSIEAKKQASMEILMSFANGNNGPSSTATNGSALENTNERALKEKSKNNQKGIKNASTATKSKPAAKSKSATKRVKANTKSKTKTATKEKKNKGSTNAKSKTKTAAKEKKNKGSTATSMNAKNGNTMSMITPDSVYKNTKKKKQTKRKTGGAKGFSKSR